MSTHRTDPHHDTPACCGHEHGASDHSHDHTHTHAVQTPHAGHAGHEHEHEHAKHDAAPCCGSDHGHAHVHSVPQASTLSGGAGQLLLRIPAMDCPTEEGQIRRALEPLAGITRLQFDLPGRTLAITAPAVHWDGAVRAIEQLGLKTERVAAPPAAADTARLRRRELLKLGAALAVAGAAELTHYLAPATLPWQVAGMAVAAIAIALSGLGVFRKGVAALLRGQLNINALMAVAVSGAFVIGQWPEAAMVMALYALAELIEARAAERARNAVTGLMSLSPPQALIQQPGGSWATVDAQAVAVGALMRVKPGERFALDGRIEQGRSSADQAPITGESLPVDKQPGDEVFAGTINQTGELWVRVSQPASDSVLARILHAIEAAQGQRAPMQRFVDRFAAVYTPAIFVLALAVALGGPLLLGWAWLAAVYKALVLLVIACPCALVISTPVTIVSGLAAAARRGILVKGGVYLEQARQLRVIALDKTGTLTEGHPRLVAHELLAGAPDALAWAHSLAARSDHPVSVALAAGLAPSLSGSNAPAVDDFAALPGRGVQGRVAGRLLRLGNHRWVEELGLCSPSLEARLAAHEAQGRSLTLLADEQQVLALFAVADTLKPGSQPALAELQALGLRTVMLSGDAATPARAIGQALGIAEVRAELLPQHKLDAIHDLARHGPVAMVGDGINDGPALAAADIGFGMGGRGSDIALEAADVLVMNDDLRRLPELIRLSRRTHAVLWQNIALALGIKAAFLGMALFDNASMWMAVFADMGASLLVVFNGLRLLGGVKARN